MNIVIIIIIIIIIVVVLVYKQKKVLGRSKNTKEIKCKCLDARPTLAGRRQQVLLFYSFIALCSIDPDE